MSTLQEKKLDFYNYVDGSAVLASDIRKDLGLSISEILAFAEETGFQVTHLRTTLSNIVINGTFLDYVYQQRCAHKFPIDANHFSEHGEISPQLFQALQSTLECKEKIDKLLSSYGDLVEADFKDLISRINYICSDEQQTHCIALSVSLFNYFQSASEETAEAVAQEWEAVCSYINKLVKFLREGKLYRFVW